MATNYNINLKRYNGTDYDTLYPKTIPAQVVGLITNGRITVGLLPDSVFDSLTYKGSTAGYSNTTVLRTYAKAVIESHKYDERTGKGLYFVASTTITLTADADYVADQDHGSIKSVIIVGDGNIGGGSSTTVEPGDWFVCDGISGSDGTGWLVTFAFISNTYEDAGTSVKGVVQLSNSTSTATTGNNVVTDSILNGLITTTVGTANKIMAAAHNHDSAYEAKDADLTAIAGLAGTAGYLKKTAANTWTLDTSTFLTAQSTDFKNITVSDTDSGFTWAATGTAAAETVGDTLTVVSGTDIDVDVDTTNDAIRVSHGNTSSIGAGAKGSAGIASITVDARGHITAVTTATYNNYSLPLATNGTRGGIQIGYTSTETNRAVELSSEKAYVTLPRQIPAVTLNGASSTSPGFYAPTASGSAGQTLESSGTGVAPAWISTSRVFYNTTTGLRTGDIFIEEAA